MSQTIGNLNYNPVSNRIIEYKKRFSLEFDTYRPQNRQVNRLNFNKIYSISNTENNNQNIGQTIFANNNNQISSIQPQSITNNHVITEKKQQTEIPVCEALSYNMCVDVKDSNGLRRCRYNFETKECEKMPLELRERATFQIGGHATIKTYSTVPKKLDLNKLKLFQNE